MSNLFLLLLGFMCLIKGADFFVDGASAIAKKFNIPSVIIGLTIVAMGTSLPEASVNIMAGFSGANDICMANVVGSNFFNILMILGVTGVMTNNLPVDKENYKSIISLIMITIMLLAASLDFYISRIESAVLMILFIYFIIDNIRTAKKLNNESTEEPDSTKVFIKKLVLGIIGIGAIILGGDLVVDSATIIAKTLGLSENFIGLTIVAMGTSLPELVTSVVAVRKNEKELAIGNVVGSNIFNILLILGLSSFINPIIVSSAALYDVVFLTMITILLFVFVKKDRNVNRKEGIVFLLLYLGYMIFSFLR